MKWYDYRYLEENIVQKDDQKLYKFMEGDFPILNLHDTEDLLLFFRVEDLKLGAESYQKKLNLTKPETSRSNISKMTPYIAYKNPQGIIYLDKFCDETLTSVRNVLHDIANNPRMEYLPKRSWSNLDRKSSRIMIKVIDQQLFEKRLIRNLGKFIGGREYGEGFRLLERTI
nr:hypothetical protein [Tanacetum cinerariifolium]